MSFRCNNCNKYTLDLDFPPCDSECRSFLPEEVLTIHYAPFNDDFKRPLFCTGEPPVTRVRMCSTPFATTCPLCLDAIQIMVDLESGKLDPSKEQALPPPETEVDSQEVGEETSDLDNPSPTRTLTSIGFSEKQAEAVISHAAKINKPSMISPPGLLAWVNEGNDITTISGIGSRSKEFLLQLLNEGN